MERLPVASEEARLEQLEQEIEEEWTRMVGIMQAVMDPKTLAKQQELLGSKVEERALLLERRRVAAVVRQFEEEHPQETEDCPICLEPMPIHMDEALTRLICCGKSTCRECFERHSLEKCPLCRARVPTSDEEAFQTLLPLANQGCAWAQLHIGYLCERKAENATSLSMRRIHEETALEWYRKAAEQGNCLARTILGKMYLGGKSLVVSHSPEEARRWIEAAALQGHTEAQEILGNMCRLGQGSPVDLEQAVYWYTLSAANSACAQGYLGYYFNEGNGGLGKCLNCSKFYLEKAGNEDLAPLLSLVLWELGKERYGSNFIPGHSSVPRCLYWLRKALPKNEHALVMSLFEKIEGEAKSHCANCRRTREACGGKLSRCARCRAAWYCGKECQRKHWKDGHKIDCFSG